MRASLGGAEGSGPDGYTIVCGIQDRAPGSKHDFNKLAIFSDPSFNVAIDAEGIGAIQLHFSEQGAGLPMVLLHAGGSSGRQWRKVGEAMADRCRLIAPDLIGFGQTPAWQAAAGLTHDDQADAVANLIGATCDAPAHIVGHSYGGGTAIRLVLREPERVASLVLIEPLVAVLLRQCGEDQLFEDYRSFAQGFIDRVSAGQDGAAWQTFIDLRNGAGAWAKMDDATRAKFLAMTQQTVDGFRSNLNNPTTLTECQSITVPTLVVCGAKTTAPEKRVTEILRDAIPASSYAVIAGAEHMSPLTHPVQVAALLNEHLRRHGGMAEK